LQNAVQSGPAATEFVEELLVSRNTVHLNFPAGIKLIDSALQISAEGVQSPLTVLKQSQPFRDNLIL
jgi:hypothetical protein